jgi:hypothetical protein
MPEPTIQDIKLQKIMREYVKKTQKRLKQQDRVTSISLTDEKGRGFEITKDGLRRLS